MKNGFRLISLQLKGHPQYGDTNFEFYRETDLKEKLPHTTLLIGPNGTGKTSLIRLLVDVFNDLYNFIEKKDERFSVSGAYNLLYQLDGTYYELAKWGGSGLSLIIDGQPADTSQLKLPQKIIGAAYSISDKLPLKDLGMMYGMKRTSRYDNEFYEYLGIKTNRGSATSLGHLYRSLDLLAGNFENRFFAKNIRAIFKYLNYDPVIEVVYTKGFSSMKERHSLLRGNITPAAFRKAVANMTEAEAGYSYRTYVNLAEQGDLLEDVIDYINRLSKSSGQSIVRFDFRTTHFKDTPFRDYQVLNILRKLGLITYKAVYVYKKNDFRINIRDASSGEIHVLTSLISLASVVKESSLILIDEPEISLHPNWQMKYVEVLNEIFKEYVTCHFLIATHSHFLVSDLEPASSSVVSLSLDDRNQVTAQLLDSETYGWSAENILYNIFGVATVRNHYFDMDLRKLIHLLSIESRQYGKIEAYIRKFERFELTPSDPLNVILKQAKKYISQA
jgi:predicted ATPase